MYRSRPMPEFVSEPAPVDLGGHPRILVVKLASLGDLLLATPALRALRLRYPAARLDLLTTGGAADLLRDSPLVDTVYRLNKYAFDAPGGALRQPRRASEAIAVGWGLRSQRYDAALLAHHLTLPFGRLKYRALLSATGARVTVGLDNGYGRYLDVRVPDRGFGWRHEVEYNVALAAAVDAPLPADAWAPTVADLGWGDIRQAPTLHPPLIALHPGSGGYSLARRWPVERWAALARALHHDDEHERDATITLLGGPDDTEVLQDIRDRLGNPTWLRVAGAPGAPGTLRTLAETLARCSLLVANDSFPMHIAAAVGTPVVAVFGPSNAQAWGPYPAAGMGRAIVVRRADLPCSPCFYRGISLGTPQGCAARPCLTALPLPPVLAAARRLLARQAALAEPAG